MRRVRVMAAAGVGRRHRHSLLRPVWHAAAAAAIPAGCGSVLSVSLSGTYTSVGEDMQRGFQLYLDTHDGRLGGRRSTWSSPTRATAPPPPSPPPQKLLKRDRVVALTGLVGGARWTRSKPSPTNGASSGRGERASRVRPGRRHAAGPVLYVAHLLQLRRAGDRDRRVHQSARSVTGRCTRSARTTRAAGTSCGASPTPSPARREARQPGREDGVHAVPDDGELPAVPEQGR